jgi:hypothetical protein
MKLFIANFIIFTRARLLAVKRRLHLLFYKEFNPYPTIFKDIYLSPSEIINDNIKLIDKELDYLFQDKTSALWKSKARNKLLELLSINNNLYCKEKYSSNHTIKKGYARKRIFLEFAKHRHAPVDIITKNTISNFKGIILCMQGSNSGAHLSLGEIKMPADVYKVAKGSSLALQAADEGFIAVSYERIGFGERREKKLNKANTPPNLDFSFHSLLMGNTSLGETVSEVVLIVKWLKNKYNLDLWLKGYSEAGTVSIVAAAIDENINGIAIGGCVGLTNDTILKRGSSGLNAIPNLLNWFDQDSIIALISPRPCIIVAGIKDHIYPYKYATKALKKPKIIYKKDRVENNLILIKGNKDHTYYPKLLWPKILNFFN